MHCSNVQTHCSNIYNNHGIGFSKFNYNMVLAQPKDCTFDWLHIVNAG